MARASKSNSFTANLGFEAKLLLAADSRSEAETAAGNRRSKLATTRRLAVMNLALRGIEADFART